MTPTDPHGAHGHGGAHHHPGPHGELENPHVAHEETDINVRAVLTTAGIVAGVGITVHILMWLLFGWFERDAVGRDPQLSPVAAPPVEMPASLNESPFFGPAAPDGVQLLTSEPMALRIHRAEEERRLRGYGWVDESAGIAHIPIAEAKKRLLERGIPVREFETAEPEVGTRIQAAGESSAGRRITGAPPPAAYLTEQPSADDAAQPEGGQQPAQEGTAKPQGH